jgi:hypothetical protein
MARFLRVVNFEKYQHYKERRPVWIKLYNAILDDPDLMDLPDASKWLAVGLLLLASRRDNRVKIAPVWIKQQLHCTEEPDFLPLVTAGWIEVYEDTDEACYQDASKLLAQVTKPASTEKSREEKEKKRTPKPPKGGYTPEFLDFWAAYPARAGTNDKQAAFKAWNARLADGYTPAVLIAGAKRYAAFCFDTDALRTQFVKMAATFLGKRDAPFFLEPWTSPPKRGIAPDSPAAKTREEKPQQEGKRTGQWETVGGKRLETDEERDDKRVEAWRKENDDAAQVLWQECINEVAETFAGKRGTFTEVAGKAMVRSRFRSRVIAEFLTPKLAAS